MWEQIRDNKRRSAFLIAALAVLLMVLGFVLGSAVDRRGGLFGLLLALGIWGVMTAVAWFQGDQIFLSMAGAREIQPADHPKLFNVVEEMKIAAGLPRMPRVWIIDDPAPNAFATGRSPETASVAVTTGLLKSLDRDELQGVIAHEIGHVKNRDILFMLMAGVMVGTIVLLGEVGWRMLRHGGGGRRRTGSGRRGGEGAAVILILAIVLAILAPIAARLFYFACSRRREYLADASGALFTRYPPGLASALEKISRPVHRPMSRSNGVTAPMFIVNPAEQAAALASALLDGNPFSTHPPTAKRIAILRSMGGGAGLTDYERAWERMHGGKRLIGKRTLAEAAPLAPREAARGPEETPIRRAREATDALWHAAGYAILSCACGAKVKIPPEAAHLNVRCPRCRIPLKAA